MNLSGILETFEQLPAYQTLLEKLRGGAPLPALHLPPSGRAALLAKLHLTCDLPVVLLTGRVDAVSVWQQALEAWLPAGHEVSRFPEPTPLPYERGPWSDRSRQDRLTVLSRMMAGQHPLLPPADKPPLVVTSARALLQKTLPRRRFIAATRLLRRGQVIDLEKILGSWQEIGYEAVTVVERPGQFSRRGGIIDIFPIDTDYPVRVELFGDEIDTLRYFNPATQRSLDLDRENPEHLLITPAREAMPVDAQPVGSWLEAEAPPKDDELPAWQDDIPDLLGGNAAPNLEYYLPLIYTRPGTALDYLPDNVLLVVDDWAELARAVDDLHQQATQIAADQVSLPPHYPNPLFAWEDLVEKLNEQTVLVLGGRDEEPPLVDEADSLAGLADAIQPGPRYGGQVRPFLAQLKQARRAGERTVVVSRQAQRLAELWHQELRGSLGEVAAGNGAAANGDRSSVLASVAPEATGTAPVEALPELPPEGSLTFVQGSLSEGFILERHEDHKILIDLLTDAEIFGWRRPAPRRHRLARPLAPETRFADITAGDYVVHLEYGIGRFAGLVVRSIGGSDREYLLLEYANGDTLYVPVHHADRLTRWIGPDDRPPSLHRLGEKSWKAAKAKAQRAADELAGELIELYASRELVVGHGFAGDGDWLIELEASFPYQETEDQLRVISEVKQDMERPLPMDRLICGDVGYGKTEVALRAAFKAVLDGKQVAILVPTTVLAQQHYNTFVERLKPFPVNVEMLSRFRTASRQGRIIKALREGQVDIVIGTHRLLSDDISFKDLGLLIIDEEQRFGVRHKETLKQLRTEVDVLTMTATPIPRTLYMSLTGVRDISIIDTAPAERLPVQTYVGEADDTILKRAILRELDRGGQVYVVHNRVQTINIIFKRLRRLVPEARTAIGHGQMSERELEQVMIDFAEGNIDILLSTTIIESGLDIPNANTLIVDRAEQFGLSQLYQLRGRVGRGDRRAYAYFFHSPWRSLNDDARARLETIAQETQLGAGYNIAMRDLELRGAGDLLGGAQSGQIASVGLDLYTRLLAQAVKRRRAELKGETVPEELPESTLIDLPLAAYVPTDYIPDAALRLRLYRRMAQLETMADIDEMAEELADRFGPIPDPVHNLLYQLRIKVLARRAKATAVTTDSGQIQIRIPNLDGVNRTQLQRYLGQAVRVSRKAIWLGRDLATHEWQVTLVQLLEKMEAYER